jgi:hypothetical protein
VRIGRNAKKLLKSDCSSVTVLLKYAECSTNGINFILPLVQYEYMLLHSLDDFFDPQNEEIFSILPTCLLYYLCYVSV